MNTMPLISVVVPVFKAEKYLPACIESLLAQTYPNMEFILVDDGSPDNSLKICQEYAAKDSRIRVIHQENAGCATARNTGLAAAKGEYIGFVDSDDTIRPETYQTAWQVFSQHPVDWVMWNNLTPVSYLPNGLIQGEQYIRVLGNSILNHGIGPSACLELFRADIIRAHHIAFRPEIKRGDDLFFVLHYGRYAKNIYYLKDKFFYNYLYNPVSLSHSFHADAFEYPEKYHQALVDIFAPVETSPYREFIQARFARDVYDAFMIFMRPANPLSLRKRLQKVRAFMEQESTQKFLQTNYSRYLRKQQALLVWLLSKKCYWAAWLVSRLVIGMMRLKNLTKEKWLTAKHYK